MQPRTPSLAARTIERAMSLALFTSDTPDAPLRWVLRHRGDVEDTGIAPSLAEFVASFPQAAALPTQLVLPGDRIAARALETPARKSSQFKQAAQFALEDDLATPLDELHLVVPSDVSDGKGVVVAVPSKWLAGWIEATQEAGLTLISITADFLLLNAAPGEATLLLDDTRLIANIGGAGFVADAEFGLGVVPEILEQTGTAQVRLYQFGDALIPEDIAATPIKLADRDELIALYSRGLGSAKAVNFLSGAYAAKTDWLGNMKAWRWAAMLAVLCGASWIGQTAIDGIRAGKAASSARIEAESLYKQAYPQENIRNLAAQARQKSGTVAPGQASFLSLMAALTTSLEKIPGITLDEITYRPDGTLEARLRFTIEELSALKASLEQQNIVFSESRNPRLDGNRYIGGLTIKSGAAG